SGPDCFAASLSSGGGNLVGVPGGCPGFGGGADVVGRQARIGSLQPNGGPTSTVALRRGSPAIGAAEADAPRRDQRNLTRRDPDAGAYERG
ncbi:MAG: choice-of-anchor Q domain-containing protein, partial [Vicinamibacteria bacterium]